MLILFSEMPHHEPLLSVAASISAIAGDATVAFAETRGHLSSTVFDFGHTQYLMTRLPTTLAFAVNRTGGRLSRRR